MNLNQQVLMVGSVVRSGKRLGKVIAVVGKRVLVLWTNSLVAAWNKRSLVRLA